MAEPRRVYLLRIRFEHDPDKKAWVKWTKEGGWEATENEEEAMKFKTETNTRGGIIAFGRNWKGPEIRNFSTEKRPNVSNWIFKLKSVGAVGYPHLRGLEALWSRHKDCSFVFAYGQAYHVSKLATNSDDATHRITGEKLAELKVKPKKTLANRIAKIREDNDWVDLLEIWEKTHIYLYEIISVEQVAFSSRRLSAIYDPALSLS